MSQPIREMVLLRFHQGLHLSRKRDDYGNSRDSLSSDSLKAALCACHAQLSSPAGSELSPEILRFMHSFQVSSAFPCLAPQAAAPQPYLPIPLSGWPQAQSDIIRHSKDPKSWRKLRFLSLPDFHQVFCEGNSLPDLPEKQEFSYRESAQRVQTAKPWWGITEPEPYFLDRIRFEEDKALWFLLDSQDAPARQQALAALRLLGDSGFGHGKTTGGGSFDFELHPFTWQGPGQGKELAWMSLGSLLPDAAAPSPLAWELLDIGGYLAGSESPQQRRFPRKRIHFYAEGSVWRQDPRPHSTWIDLSPQGFPHPVYRDGRSISLPIAFPQHLNPDPHGKEN